MQQIELYNIKFFTNILLKMITSSIALFSKAWQEDILFICIKNHLIQKHVFTESYILLERQR